MRFKIIYQKWYLKKLKNQNRRIQGTPDEKWTCSL